MNRPVFWANARQLITPTRLLAMALLAFALWSTQSEMDQTVRSSGQVIAVARNQIIQAADGGVLTQLLVSEGQRVQAGQVVAKLETTRSEAGFQEIQAKLTALQAARMRARAESTGNALSFDEKFDARGQFKLAQEQIYKQKKQSLDEDLALLNSSLLLSEEELRISQSLFKSGDLSQIELMKSQRQLHDSQGRILSLKNKYLHEAKLELVRLEEEISSNQFKLNERQSLLDHSVLTTPVAGIVKVLRINTVGGVLRAGDELMHISPTESGQVIEAKINPSDIGELKVGLPVSIKLDAFDFSMYGMLNGTLSHIGSDTLTESGANGATQTYYRIQVELAPIPVSNRIKASDLKPGMTASLDIRTRSRSVWQYLTKPIQKAFSGALHER
ncbi:MAG: HlyD family efflux transporter periplasmic adaptor subunit [Burkholderiales bacterium]|nr:HlyD family efflux transporter periplasmic adaptor subunit [Burkholderiales bacterium]